MHENCYAQDTVSQVTRRMRSQRQGLSRPPMSSVCPQLSCATRSLPLDDNDTFFSYNVCLFSILPRSGWFPGFKGWSLYQRGMTSGHLSSSTLDFRIR